MARQKKKNRWYCIQCLRKFHRLDLPESQLCPHCGIPARNNTSRVVCQVVTRLLRARGIKAPKVKTDYQKYLTSPIWKEIRQRVMARDGGTCQACGKLAIVVHHKSYERAVLDGQRDDMLVSLCLTCHRTIEFETDANGKDVKNSLTVANRKLSALMAGKPR